MNDGFDGAVEETHLARLAEYDTRARARHAADMHIDEQLGHEEDKLLLDAITNSDSWLVARIFREGLDSFAGPFRAARFEDEGISCTILPLRETQQLLVITRDEDEQLIRRHFVDALDVTNARLNTLAQSAIEVHWS